MAGNDTSIPDETLLEHLGFLSEEPLRTVHSIASKLLFFGVPGQVRSNRRDRIFFGTFQEESVGVG
jgi:hypothetical protein